MRPWRESIGWSHTRANGVAFSTRAARLVAGRDGPRRNRDVAPRPMAPHRARPEPHLDGRLAGSRSTGRPVLVLFDEVPGCATCRGFGAEVLSHPLIADAIESEFVPLFVANCRPGRDAEWLARFGEPAWNNPVVRFLDARGHDVIARADELYSPHEIAARLAEALRAAGRPVPGYLALAIEETQTAHRREATLGMRSEEH